MFLYAPIAYLVCLQINVQYSHGNPITNEVQSDHELVFAMVVNRHGERSPDEDELSLSDQQDKIRNLTYLEGPEGLTNKGKKRAYHIGKFYKQRYGPDGLKLISNLYLPGEIYIRSTDKDRTKMTIQTAMAATYPPEEEQQWGEGVGKVWQPVPYTAVPLSEDYLRYYSNCAKYQTLIEAAKDISMDEEFKCYHDLIKLLNSKTGRNFTENPLLFQTLFDLFRSTQALGLNIPEWSKPVLPRIAEVAKLAYKLYYRTEEMKRIGGGVLLHNFMEAADLIISGKAIKQRLRLYSAHDFNIGAFMEVAQVKNDAIPEYGSVFALELYKSKSSGSYFVMPVYLPQAGNSSPQQLRIIGCEDYAACDFNKFSGFVKNYLLTEKEFYDICNIRTEL